MEFCPGGGIQRSTSTQSRDARQAVVALNSDRTSPANITTASSNEEAEERNMKNSLND